MGLMTVWHRETGQSLRVHAVDAAELCTQGEYVTVPPHADLHSVVDIPDPMPDEHETSDAPDQAPGPAVPRRGPGRQRATGGDL